MNEELEDPHHELMAEALAGLTTMFGAGHTSSRRYVCQYPEAPKSFLAGRDAGWMGHGCRACLIGTHAAYRNLDEGDVPHLLLGPYHAIGQEAFDVLNRATWLAANSGVQPGERLDPNKVHVNLGIIRQHGRGLG